MQIIFQDWTLTAVSGPGVPRQYDDKADVLTVAGAPEGWAWEALVSCGDKLNVLTLTALEGGVGAVLTADDLALSGHYRIQLRGKKDGVTRHSSIVSVMVASSMSGDASWPEVPAAFTQAVSQAQAAADRAEAAVVHGPIISDGQTWMVWDAETGGYVDTGVKAGGSAVQSDWTQNDETQADYIKGRIGGYSVRRETGRYLPAGEVLAHGWISEEGGNMAFLQKKASDFVLEAGKEYFVLLYYPESDDAYDAILEGKTPTVLVRCMAVEGTISNGEQTFSCISIGTSDDLTGFSTGTITDGWIVALDPQPGNLMLIAVGTYANLCVLICSAVTPETQTDFVPIPIEYTTLAGGYDAEETVVDVTLKAADFAGLGDLGYYAELDGAGVSFDSGTEYVITVNGTDYRQTAAGRDDK